MSEGAAEPKGQMVIALNFSIAPTWFDPAETPAITTPFIFMYALHDGLLKPLPGNVMAPSLAESWGESAQKLQRRIHDRVMFAPIFEPATFHAVGPRVAEPAVGITPLFYFPVPYEEMRLKE